jgi:hypothetical protein
VWLLWGMVFRAGCHREKSGWIKGLHNLFCMEVYGSSRKQNQYITKTTKPKTFQRPNSHTDNCFNPTLFDTPTTPSRGNINLHHQHTALQSNRKNPSSRRNVAHPNESTSLAPIRHSSGVIRRKTFHGDFKQYIKRTEEQPEHIKTPGWKSFYV